MGAVALCLGVLVAFNPSLPLQLSKEQSAAIHDAIQSIFEFSLGFIAFALYFEFQRRDWKLGRASEFAVLSIAGVAVWYADKIPGLWLSTAAFLVVFIFAFEGGPISRFLLHPYCRKLGTVSYSVYLTHSVYLGIMEYIVFEVARRLNTTATVNIGGADLLALGGLWVMDGAAVICVAITILGSILTYRFVEEPMRQFFNRLSDRTFSPLVSAKHSDREASIT